MTKKHRYFPRLPVRMPAASSMRSQERPSIPDHELFRVIGQGAFGEVWLASNVMGIWRAVKVLWRSDFSGADAYEREFEAIRRYEPVARSTEGLVQVLHVGRNDEKGYFYYVMELADDSTTHEAWHRAGPTLSALAQSGTIPSATTSDPTRTAKEHPLPVTSFRDPGSYAPRTLRSELSQRGRLNLDEVLAISSALTRGLVHLHGVGLVHRDIKPSNVIFVHGHARLADMGLVDRQGHMSYAGTEGYVPPEGTGTPAADVYSLGLTIYEMATGCDRKQFPQLPMEWLTACDPNQWELHEVILRACEGLPERRYRTAAELKADLAMISSGQSIRERRALVRRSRSLKVIGAVATFGFVITLGWALLSKQRVRMEKQALIQAERQRAQTELALVESHLAQAAANRQTGRTGQRYESLARVGEALERLRRLATNSVAPVPATRLTELKAAARDEAIAAMTRVDLREIGRCPAPFDRQWGLPVDGALRRLARAGPSNTVSIFSLPEGLHEVQLPAGPEPVERVGPFSADGQFLMVRYKNRENWVWNTGTREVAFRQPASGAHLRAVFWRGGLLIPGDKVLTWSSLTRRKTEWTSPLSEQLMWLVAAEDDQHVVGFTRWFKDACWLRGEPTVEISRTPFPPGFNMGRFAVSREGRHLALTLLIGEAPVLDMANPTAAPMRLAGHSAEVVGAAFHPNGYHLATSSWDGTTRIWDWTAGEMQLLHDGWTAGLRFSTDGSRCAMPVGDSPRFDLIISEFAAPRCVRIRRLNAAKEAEPIRKVSARASFSADSRWLAISTGYGVRLFTVPEVELRGTLGSNEVYAVRFMRQAQTLVSAGHDGQWRWELRRVESAATNASGMNPVASFSHQPGLIDEFTLGRDGEPIALLRHNRAFFRGGVPGEWRPVAAPGDHLWLATSGDGTWLAVSSAHRLHEFRLPDGTSRWDTPLRGIAFFDFSPDGRQLAVLDADGVRCLEAASGKLVWHLPRVDDYVRVGRLAWSSDGRWLAAALRRRDVSLIEGQTGRIAARLTSPSQAAVSATAFSPNDRYLAVTLIDQSVQLWDLQALHEDLATLGLGWRIDPSKSDF